MRKIPLLALLAFNALAPQLHAQDDDAELGQTPSEPKKASDSSIIDDSNDSVEPAPERSGPPVSKPIPAPEKMPAAPQASEPASESSASNEKSSPGWWIEGRRRPGASFGIGAFRPESIGKYNHYDYLYGKEKVSPYFYGGYYLFSYILDIGLMGRVGYYHAEGHPLAERPEMPLKRDLENERKDGNQKLGLTLIPTQLAAEIALSPFKTRWVVLRAWTGVEYLYVQETIEPNLPSSAAGQSQASTYTSSGWNQGLVTGAMASFSLTGLDARSDKSLRSLGIDRYFLSLFAENITTTRDKFGNFDRKNYGIAFSFEGLR